MNPLEQVMKSSRKLVVDVRTPAEFSRGNVDGSINIPLNELPQRLEELKTGDHIVLCCASGMRSMQAAGILDHNGIACTDGGSWFTLQELNNR